MVIGLNKLLQMVNDPSIKLIENLSARESLNPEGVVLDLRLGEIYLTSQTEGGYLGLDERSTPNANLIASYQEGKVEKIEVKKGEYYLIKTVEKINLPLNTTVLFFPRSTVFRSGVHIATAPASPGYHGKLVFGMFNITNTPFVVEMGARIVQALFLSIDGTSSSYRGQWQGGRIRAQKEKQV